MRPLYVHWVSRASRLAGILSAGLLLSAVLVVCQMIFMRYVLRASTIWQTEYVIYAVVAATFLGSAEVLARRGHVGVDLLPERLGERGGRTLRLLGGIVTLAFLAVLGWSSLIYLEEAIAGGWRTETVWALPLWIPLLPMSVGLVLLALQEIAELLRSRPEP